MGYVNDYEQALKTLATVHCFEEFGSYQGDWWAKVTYQGTTGWVTGSYGSCSGCDAFQAEMGWDNPTEDKLKAFAIGYLEGGMILSQEEAVKEASKYLSWDQEAKKAVDFIINNAIV